MGIFQYFLPTPSREEKSMERTKILVSHAAHCGLGQFFVQTPVKVFYCRRIAVQGRVAPNLSA